MAVLKHTDIENMCCTANLLVKVWSVTVPACSLSKGAVCSSFETRGRHCCSRARCFDLVRALLFLAACWRRLHMLCVKHFRGREA